MASSADTAPVLKRGLSWDGSSVQQLETLANGVLETTDPATGRAALETLFKMASNIQEHPNEEKYHQVRLANKTFNTKVWSHPAAQEFLFTCGWTVVDDLLVLPADSNLEEARRVLEKVICITEPVSPRRKSPAKRAPEKDKQLDKERKAREEQMQKQKEEKRRLAEKIKADRKETSQRQSKDSKAVTRPFGSDVKRFQDIGVDVNSQGG
ncbi:UBX domain-containing protein 6-like [Corticium candelabrum]|uniref:UBX domain-containing protein 6-like n=1 Tax=Corticium candelabrum TaxID=121492 RepID=UPI002E26B824|nr:UBX domain-containing protein 6-like [Corticium candelabrum]